MLEGVCEQSSPDLNECLAKESIHRPSCSFRQKSCERACGVPCEEWRFFPLDANCVRLHYQIPKQCRALAQRRAFHRKNQYNMRNACYKIRCALGVELNIDAGVHCRWAERSGWIGFGIYSYRIMAVERLFDYVYEHSAQRLIGIVMNWSLIYYLPRIITKKVQKNL